jgi:uncharacterized protein YraI
MRSIQHLKWINLLQITLCLGGLGLVGIHTERVLAQEPTITSVPAATATKAGPMLTVHAGGEPQINVRSGPGRGYDTIGTLVVGQWVPALGRTPGGDWIQIAYPGASGGVAWVYAYLTDVTGDLPVIEPPPTPTPFTTPTIDPTRAAQFIIDIPPTRLPTFTPSPPLIVPTFQPEIPMRGSGGQPIGLVIVVLGAIGLFGGVISLLRRR